MLVSMTGCHVSEKPNSGLPGRAGFGAGYRRYPSAIAPEGAGPDPAPAERDGCDPLASGDAHRAAVITASIRIWGPSSATPMVDRLGKVSGANHAVQAAFISSLSAMSVM